MRYLNTLYVNGYSARISRQKRALVVTREDGKERVPLRGLDAVVMIGGAGITTDAAAACAEEGVRVAVLRRSGKVRFTVGPPKSGNVHLRLAQYSAASEPRATLEMARVFVAAKLQSSRRVVQRWARDGDASLSGVLTRRAELIADRLSRLTSAPSGDHVRGIEGDAARASFSAMALVLADSSLPFAARSRRPPRDPVNALLGFCYGLVVTEIVGAVEAIGLDHQIGFLHQPRSGRPSLALDIAEEFRPLVDRFVVTMVRRREVGPDHFVTTPGGGCYLSDEGRSGVIRAWERSKAVELPHLVLQRPVTRWALPAVQATLLARHLRGDLPVYPPFVVAA